MSTQVLIGTATPYGPWIEFQWGVRFSRPSPDRPCDPPSLLHSGYLIPFPGVKWQGRGVNN